MTIPAPTTLIGLTLEEAKAKLKPKTSIMVIEQDGIPRAHIQDFRKDRCKVSTKNGKIITCIIG